MTHAAQALPPLVLVPGLLNDADLWHGPADLLRDAADCRVGEITGFASLQDAAAQLLAQAPARFALAGFSLGGYVAQEMLRQAPGRIVRLALLDTACQPDTPDQAARRASASRAVELGRGHFSGFGERIAERFLAPQHARDPVMVARVRAMTVRLGADVFLRQNAWDRPDGRAALAMFRGPALVLCGALDQVTPPMLSQEMAGLLHNGTLVLLPGCGHLSPIECPAEVAAALRQWLVA